MVRVLDEGYSLLCVRGILNGEKPQEILGRVPALGRYRHTRE